MPTLVFLTRPLAKQYQNRTLRCVLEAEASRKISSWKNLSSVCVCCHKDSSFIVRKHLWNSGRQWKVKLTEFLGSSVAVPQDDLLPEEDLFSHFLKGSQTEGRLFLSNE